MNGEIKDGCRETLEELWSSWPEVPSLSATALKHMEGCPSCGTELESLRAQGRLEAWAEVVPAARWARLAASTKRALASEPARPLRWAPAFALAAAGIAFAVWRALPPRVPQPVPAALAEVVENLDLLEHLDLVENMDMIDAVVPDKGGTPL